MKAAKISQVQGDGTWNKRLPDGNTQLMYAFIVTFDDGVTAQANAQSDSPRWMKADKVWYKQYGDHNGTPKVTITDKDPSASPRSRGGNTDPETIKRIENSWAVHMGISALGEMHNYTEGEDEYLSAVYRLAKRFKKMRDKLGEQ
tara:strand:+ start:8069 stop:8503 length:435 start_codon:yes stop_codon:yes gene_type:complete